MSYQMTLLTPPTIFTTPTSNTRYYFTASPHAVINGKVYALDAYSDPDTTNTVLQPQTYIGYSFDASGNVTQVNGIAGWINAYSPQSVPNSNLEYELRGFNGPTSKTVAGSYFDTIDGTTGAETFHLAAIDLSGASPVVHQVGTSITVNPISKTLNDNVTAEVANLASGNSLNEQLFEVDGSPSDGEVQGTYMIFDASGNVLVAPTLGNGFDFTDGKAHTFAVGAWNRTKFAELVEVWNPSTNLADLGLGTIDASTGAGYTGWGLATELQSITRIGWQFNSGVGSGMVVVADGSDAGGRGFFEYLVDDSSSYGGTGGTILKSLAVHYTGTVKQDARISSSGVANEYVLDWVDGSGLNVELIDKDLNVLAKYNVPEANGTSAVTSLGNGEILVEYRVAQSSGGYVSAVNKSMVLDIFSPSPHDFNGDGNSDLLWQNDSGAVMIWEMNGTSVTDNTTLGVNPGPKWHAIGTGDFNNDGFADILWQNDSGAVSIWEMNGTSVVSNPTLKTNPGPAWHVIATGDFNGDHKADILWQNTNGAVSIWEMNGTSVIANPTLHTNPGPAWHVINVGDFNGDGKSDILWQNTNGAVSIWEMNGTSVISNPTLKVNPGPSWHVADIGDFNDDGKSDILWQNTNGAVSIWEMNGASVISNPTLKSNPGSAWHVVNAADYNSDGHSDIAFQNDSGAAMIWEMDGTGILSSTTFSNPGSSWHLIGPHHGLTT